MFLVFDVGATFVKCALMTMDGEIKEKNKFPTCNKKGDGVEEFVSSIVSVYETYKTKAEIEGIAMGLPGQIDVDNGIVYGGGGLPFLDGLALGSLISKRCDGIRVSLENDGKCAALAEVWMGNAKDCRDACVLVFGTGIGGGIIIDRKVHRGKRLLAGELSYSYSMMTREEADKVKNLEEDFDIIGNMRQNPFMLTSACSSTGLCVRVADAKKIPVDSVNGELIYKWAAEGDRVAIDALEDTYFSIAKTCCNLYVTLDPDIILIGGGISAQPAFVEGIRRYAKKLMKLTKTYDGLRLDTCKFRNDSNLLGALYNFMQKYELV